MLITFGVKGLTVLKPPNFQELNLYSPFLLLHNSLKIRYENLVLDQNNILF